MIPTLKPLTVADLIVLKQRLERYEYGEIAHIENVMAKERRLRTHRRLRQFETRLLEEVEREEERRTDLETTERFQVETEMERELRSEERFSAGLEVSGGFGPVNVSAYARYDRETSLEESQRTAQEYAKEITAKVVERIKERVRTEREQIERLETEETNEHEFDNASDAHVTGVYRWVDKYYRLKSVPYGKRLFYDVVVPEPAALLLFSRLLASNSRALPELPREPVMYQLGAFPAWAVEPFLFFADISVRLAPYMIDADNYAALASKYGAPGLQPPPPPSVVVTRSIAKEFEPAEDWIIDGQDVRLPDDYEAVSCEVTATVKTWGWHRDGTFWPYPPGHYPGFARIQIGRHAIVYRGDDAVIEALSETTTHEVLLHRERGSVPVSAAGNTVGALALNFEVTCERTPESFARWQMGIYDAIMAAYKRSLVEYEDRVAAARAGEGVRIAGENPLRNLLTIKTELKRLFLKLWMGDDLFGLPVAVTDGDATTAPPRLPELLRDGSQALANSPTTAFAEEAFDWDNMSFRFLPYFHGRQDRWIDLSGFTDPDPVFENFLKAGAAIVRVPAVPEYTHAVLYYQLTGRIWPREAGNIPALTDVSTSPDAELYNDYLAELDPTTMETDLHGEAEISSDDPKTFVIKVPTSLVALPGSHLNPE